MALAGCSAVLCGAQHVQLAAYCSHLPILLPPIATVAILLVKVLVTVLLACLLHSG